MEYLDLRFQSIPFELLNGVGAGAKREICNQLPLDSLSTRLLGMDHRRGQRGIALLLYYRRQDANLATSDLEDGFIGITVAVSDADAMHCFEGDLVQQLRELPDIVQPPNALLLDESACWIDRFLKLAAPSKFDGRQSKRQPIKLEWSGFRKPGAISGVRVVPAAEIVLLVIPIASAFSL